MPSQVNDLASILYVSCHHKQINTDYQVLFYCFVAVNEYTLTVNLVFHR